MFISNKGKFILIANPKTATTSFSQMMKENFDFINNGGHSGSLGPIPNKYKGYSVIMIHRHPYERFLSRWYSVVKNINKFNGVSPVNFFKKYINNETGLDMCHILPQSNYLLNKKIDYLISFNNVAEELKNVPALSDIDFSKYQLGVYNGGIKTEYLTDELLELLNEYYNEDFKNFCYDKIETNEKFF